MRDFPLMHSFLAPQLHMQTGNASFGLGCIVSETVHQNIAARTKYACSGKISLPASFTVLGNPRWHSRWRDACICEMARFQSCGRQNLKIPGTKHR